MSLVTFFFEEYVSCYFNNIILSRVVTIIFDGRVVTIIIIYLDANLDFWVLKTGPGVRIHGDFIGR